MSGTMSMNMSSLETRRQALHRGKSTVKSFAFSRGGSSKGPEGEGLSSMYVNIPLHPLETHTGP